MIGRLPNFFKFKTAKDLVRLGRPCDGGYLVSQADIDKSDVLVGLGIYDDWSFESDFVKQNDVPVFAYDASVSKEFFINQLLRSLVEVKNPKEFIYWLRVNGRYRKFFSNKKHKHIKKFVGLTQKSKEHCTLESVLQNTNSDNVFLKIDIEGSEYRLLETIVQCQNRITGLVIEFHDCDLHLARIKKFIRSFELRLVHIHANNDVPLRLDDDLPLVLELTFSSNAEVGESEKLPHPLDMPNSVSEDEIRLVIEQ